MNAPNIHLLNSITASKGSDALATAKELLLSPGGIAIPDLQRTLSDMYTHRLDDADLYFQHTRNESWSLEEGIVKSGSFSIDQGVGVRAISGEKTAFAYADEINLDTLAQAAKATRVIGPAGGKKKIVIKGEHQAESARTLYHPNDPLSSLSSAEKIKLLERIEKRARAKDPRIVQVMAGLAGEFDVVLVARANGVLAADIRPLVRVSVTVIAEQNGRREVGTAGGGGRTDYGYFSNERVDHWVDEAVRSALVNLEARETNPPLIKSKIPPDFFSSLSFLPSLRVFSSIFFKISIILLTCSS